LLAAAAFVGRAAWRAHLKIVSLDIREAPLRVVLKKIEWQTWEPIRAEQGLDAKVTLHVLDEPLTNVLDRIAQQIGARWSTVFAVYDSAITLALLDRALQSDGKLEPAWVKLAPVMPEKPPPGLEEGERLMHAPGPGPGAPPGPRRMMFTSSPNGPTVLRNGKGEVEVWSAEELVMAAPLQSRLGKDSAVNPDEPLTAAAISEAARKVDGKVARRVAFRKSILGVGFSKPPTGGHMTRPPNPNPSERFLTLTPAQRVQRARARIGSDMP
jgi:hypothetical protein